MMSRLVALAPECEVSHDRHQYGKAPATVIGHGEHDLAESNTQEGTEEDITIEARGPM